jgi:hypothetical protein
MLSFSSDSQLLCSARKKELETTLITKAHEILNVCLRNFLPPTFNYDVRVFDWHLNSTDMYLLRLKLYTEHGVEVVLIKKKDVLQVNYTGFYIDSLDDGRYEEWYKRAEAYAFEWLFSKLNQTLVAQASKSTTTRNSLFEFEVNFDCTGEIQQDPSITDMFREHLFGCVFKWIEAITPYHVEISSSGKSILMEYKCVETARIQSQNRLNAVIFSSLTIVRRKPAYTSSSMDGSFVEESKPDWHALPQTVMRLIIHFLVGKVNI